MKNCDKNKNDFSFPPLTADSSPEEMRRVTDAISDNSAAENGKKPSGRGGSFALRLRSLFEDKRSPRLRLSISACAAFAFVFTFIIFGPFELYIQSARYLSFPFSDLVIPVLLVGTASFAVIFGILALLRGKIYNCAVTSLFAVTVAGYIQRNFLNVDHGTLDGHAIEWTEYASAAVLDLLFWLAVAAAAFLILYFSRCIWTHTVRVLSLILVGAQAVALAVMLFSGEGTAARENSVICSTEGLYNVTDGENVVFFLLDRYDNQFADKLLEKNPAWKELLSGFTYYHNFTGSYTRTMPSVTYLLTGIKCDYTMPYDEYFKEAWSSSLFLPGIKRAGYAVRIYSDAAYAFGDSANLSGIADNFVDAKQSVNTSLMLDYMFRLAAYVYSPEALKPYFWMYTGDFAAISEGHGTYTVNDPKFWGGFREEGLTVEHGRGMFTFYHLSGSHEPYIMNEEGKKVPLGTGTDAQLAQTAGDMNMIFQYLDALREAGTFDNTTIIISADHGRTGTLRELDGVRCPALFIKPAHADCKEPMKISNKQVCQDNLRASILSYLGIDPAEYGRTVESIGEDEEVVRLFYMQACDESRRHRDVETVTYEIRGDANVFDNWREVERTPILFPFYDSDPINHF